MTVHQRFERLAAIAIDFEPTAAERLELAAHLAICPDCRRAQSILTRQAVELRDRVRAMPSEALRGRVLAGTAATRVKTRDASSLRLLAIAAAFALLTVGGLLTVGARPTPTETTAPTSGPITSVEPGGLPVVGDVTSLAVPAGQAAHDHECHIIVESECAASIVATDAAIWTTSATGIVRMDRNSGLIAYTADVSPFPHPMAATPDGSVWVGLGGPDRLARIPAAGTEAVEVPSSERPSQMVVSGDHLWVVRPTAKKVDELDAATGRQLASLVIDGEPWGVVDLDGAIWVVDRLARTLWRLDQGSIGIAQTIDLAGRQGGTLHIDEQVAGASARVAAIEPPLAAFHRIWIPGFDAMLVVDPSASRVWAVGLPTIASITAAPGGVVVVSRVNKVVELIDAVSMQVSARQDLLELDWNQWDLPSTATPDGSIWLRDYVRDSVLRITPR